MNISKRLITLMGKNRIWYLVGSFCSVITMTIAISAPVITGTAIDIIIGNELMNGQTQIVNLLGGSYHILNNLWIPFAIVVTLALIRSCFAYIAGLTSARASDNIALKMQNDIYNHLQNLPYDYHVKAKTGDLIQRCTSDVENIRAFLASQVNEIVRTTLYCSFILIVLLNMDIRLTVISIFIIPVIFLFTFLFHKKMKDVFEQQDHMEGELFSTMQENLSGVRVVRAFGRSSFESEQFEKKNTEFRNLARKFASIRAVFWGSSDFLCFLQILLTLYFGVIAVNDGTISTGTYFIFVSYISLLVWPIRNLARVFADMGRMEVSLNRIEEMLHTPIEEETIGATEHDLAGDIIFEDVNFSYDEKLILNGLSMHIKQGETIAILGGTGSGKSTIMHLLLRLYDYESGSIKINNKEIKNIRKKHLRERIGMVLQEPYLYSKTIEQNLKMAKTNVTNNEIYQATKTAKVHETIESFEKGYDTLLGERGVTLSGGQRQRVAIARTIIKNSEILVFDDSLSAVDTDTDQQIRKALKERSKNTTTIIISGRISTLKEADRIFILESGRVTDIGNHDELITRDSLYKKIWDIQTSLESELEEDLSFA